MPQVSPARRADSPDAEVEDLLGSDDSRITMRSLVQQGISAVLVGMLGLFALAGISTVASPYSAAAAGATTTVAGSVDVARAEPAPITTDPDLGGTTQDTTADLDDPSRNEDLSRNTLRSELSKAVSEEMAQQRNDSLAQVAEQVAVGAQNSATDARAAALTGQSDAITGEQARLEAAAKAEAAAKEAAAQIAREQAAAAAGTLKSPKAGTSASSNSSLDAALAALSSGGCTAPMAPGSYIRSAGFGAYGSWARYHTGVDLVAPYGTPIRAACDGVVLGSSGGSWAGINLSIAHPGGGATLYAHMSSRTVKAGDFVKAGQVIGYVGLTGRTFGPHLHFEYYPNPSTIGNPYSAADPASYLLRKGVRI